MTSDPDKSYEYVKNYRHKVRLSIYSGFGGRCCICGYDRCARSLELHHLNPDTKLFALSAWSSHNWKSILDEAEKCIMLCANCHGEVEDNLVTVPLDVKRFDRQVAQQVKNRFPKGREAKRCSDCGAKIKSASMRCLGCHRKQVFAGECAWCKKNFTSSSPLARYCEEKCKGAMKRYKKKQAEVAITVNVSG